MAISGIFDILKMQNRSLSECTSEDTRLDACESFDLLIEPFALSFCPSKSFPVSGHFRHFLGLMRWQTLMG